MPNRQTTGMLKIDSHKAVCLVLLVGSIVIASCAPAYQHYALSTSSPDSLKRGQNIALWLNNDTFMQGMVVSYSPISVVVVAEQNPPSYVSYSSTWSHIDPIQVGSDTLTVKIEDISMIYELHHYDPSSQWKDPEDTLIVFTGGFFIGASIIGLLWFLL